MVFSTGEDDEKPKIVLKDKNIGTSVLSISIFIFHCLYPFLIYSVSYNDWAFEPITDFNWIIVANVLFSGRLNYIFALN